MPSFIDDCSSEFPIGRMPGFTDDCSSESTWPLSDTEVDGINDSVDGNTFYTKKEFELEVRSVNDPLKIAAPEEYRLRRRQGLPVFPPMRSSWSCPSWGASHSTAHIAVK